MGQILYQTNSLSALAEVSERAIQIKGATFEVKSIIEEYQMQALDGMMSAWELWERALVPSLLSGAGTWLGNISETEKVCNDLQYFFWRIMLNVPESCPKVGLLCDTKIINMKYRIYKEKC